MAEYHLAQLNIAKMKYPVESAEMSSFFELLEGINALAADAPGFVWRLPPEDEGADGMECFDDDVLPNLSLWTDLESLREFAFRSPHREVLARRAEWFVPIQEAYSVLWWVPAGHLPTPREAAERLDCLRRDGPGPRAFTFRLPHDPA